MPKTNHGAPEDCHTHAQQDNVRLNNAKNQHILLEPHERSRNKYHFSSKNMGPDLPCFHVIST